LVEQGSAPQPDKSSKIMMNFEILFGDYKRMKSQMMAEAFY